MKITQSIYFVSLLAAGAGMFSCQASGDNPGTEYAQNMYHSVPYEPLSQITDENKGSWLSSREDGKGEFYNSNPNNPYGMTMRQPAANTVPRNIYVHLHYLLDVSDYETASLTAHPF